MDRFKKGDRIRISDTAAEYAGMEATLLEYLGEDGEYLYVKLDQPYTIGNGDEVDAVAIDETDAEPLGAPLKSNKEWADTWESSADED